VTQDEGTISSSVAAWGGDTPLRRKLGDQTMKSEYVLLITGRSGNQPTIMEILIGLYIQKHDGTLGDEHARRVRKARAKPFFCFIG
jgi:hypothetical protein